MFKFGKQMNKIQELEMVISHLDSLYEKGEDCVHPLTNLTVSDGEYDALRRELSSLHPNSHVFKTPTASKVEVVKKIIHNPPMTSISKASHEDKNVQMSQLEKWIDDCKSSMNDKNDFYQAYKLDGVACALYYENGLLVGAGLRPRDGINGEDITKQIKYVEGVPEKLKLPLTCSFRGEIICKLSNFELVQKELEDAGEKVRANPRNHAAGGIRQFKDPEKVKNNKLSFIAYSIEGLDKPIYKTEIERAIWCNKKVGIQFVRTEPFDISTLKKMEDNVPSLDYEVDGVIIGVNNLEEQEQLGRHGDNKTGNPKGKIAWKFSEEKAYPIIESIEWNVGRTGNIKPVANFKPVALAGTQVSRATLHNLGFIFRSKIDTGTEIVVLKAGKIIPKVVGVSKNLKSYSNVEEVDCPKLCPSCSQNTKILKNNEMYELYCENEDCPARNVNAFCHFLKTLGVLGLGESKISVLLESGCVKNYSDFYKIKLNDCLDAGFSERQSLLILASIHMIPNPEKYEDEDLKKKISKEINNKKKFPLWKLFASFGIEAAGKSAGKTLSENFDTFESLLSTNVETLSSMNDIGNKTAELIVNYIKNNKDKIVDLLNYIEIEKKIVGKFTGKTFVFTGGFDQGKSFYETKVEELGGKVSSSVSKKIDYVVVGTDAGSKSQKADDLGVKKIDVKELLNLMKGN
jgi:DNA ligase (NAD+)